MTEQMGFFWPSIHSKISQYMLDNFLSQGYKKAELINLSEIILPIYQNAIIEKNLPVFQLGDPDSIDTLDYTAQTTNLDRSLVNNYLYALELAAKNGYIDYKHWQPIAKDLRAETEKPEPLTIPGTNLQLPQLDVAKGIDKQFTKLFVTVGIVAGVFLIGREFIRKF